MAKPVHYRDALFAYIETAQSPQTMMAAYAFASSDQSSTDLARWIADRATRLAPLRQRMVRAVGDIGSPVWSDDPHFDARRHVHVHEAADWEALCALLPRIHAAPFDRSRPLWEAHLIRGVRGINGLSTPCDVVVGKLHHAVADGEGAIAIAHTLFGGELPSRYVPGKPMSKAAVSARAVAKSPVAAGRFLRDLVRFTRAQKQVRAERADGLWKMPAKQWPRTAVNQKIGLDRIVDVAFFDVDELRAVARAIGDVTVNDLVLTIIGGALSDHLGEIDGSLAASVPFSTRSILETDARNRFTTASVDLHTEIADMAARAHAVRDSMRAEWARKLSPANVHAESVAPHLPGFVIRAAVRVFHALPKNSPTIPGANVLATTVPMGPTNGWELCGAPIVASFGMSTLLDPGGVGHVISSIGKCLAICVTADPGQVRELAEYMNLIRAGYARLTEQAAA